MERNFGRESLLARAIFRDPELCFGIDGSISNYRVSLGENRERRKRLAFGARGPRRLGRCSPFTFPISKNHFPRRVTRTRSRFGDYASSAYRETDLCKLRRNGSKKDPISNFKRGLNPPSVHADEVNEVRFMAKNVGLSRLD